MNGHKTEQQIPNEKNIVKWQQWNQRVEYGDIHYKIL